MGLVYGYQPQFIEPLLDVFLEHHTKLLSFLQEFITYVNNYQHQIDKTFNQINTTFSTYSDDSELMRLNQSKGNLDAPVVRFVIYTF